MSKPNAYVIGAMALAPRNREVMLEQEPPEPLPALPPPEAEIVGESGGSALKPFAEEVKRFLAPVPADPLGGKLLKSEIPGVSDQAWTAFALAMKVQASRAVSASNDLGMFAMKVRRLADLGLIDPATLKKSCSPSGKTLWTGKWNADLSQDAFLASTRMQYRVFSASMQRYANYLMDGELPEGLSLSGALAVMHRCGPRGVERWNSGDRFEDTIELVNKVNGIF